MLAASFVVAHIWTRATLEAELGARLEAVASAVAAPLSNSSTAGRIARLKADSDLTRARIRDGLEVSRAASNLRRIRLVSPSLELLVDTEATTPGVRQFDLEADRAEFESVLHGGPARASVLFESAEGDPFKRGWAAITNEDRVVALLVVEARADAFAMLAEMQLVFAGLFGLAALLVLLASSLIARRLTARLGRLAGAAERIAQGSTDEPIDADGADEIAGLAGDLETMRRAIVQREEDARVMLAGIAHEVRNPLAGMGLHAELARDALADDHPASEHVRAVEGDLHHLGHVVNSFLAFARAQPGRMRPHSVAELVRDAVDTVEPARSEHGVRIEIDVEATLRWVCDRDQLRGVVVNLLDNALRVSSSGTRVRVAARAEATASKVELTIEDEGPGMTGEVLAQATRPFFTTRSRGSGLGLALARRVVEQHRGALTLTSAPGRGTRVRVSLPSVVDAEGSPSPVAASDSAAGPDDEAMIG